VEAPPAAEGGGPPDADISREGANVAAVGENRGEAVGTALREKAGVGENRGEAVGTALRENRAVGESGGERDGVGAVLVLAVGVALRLFVEDRGGRVRLRDQVLLRGGDSVRHVRIAASAMSTVAGAAALDSPPVQYEVGGSVPAIWQFVAENLAWTVPEITSSFPGDAFPMKTQFDSANPDLTPTITPVLPSLSTKFAKETAVTVWSWRAE
jgi:hypothetical protein